MLVPHIGIAIEAPDTSAFFNDLHRLVIGRKNQVSTMYSSAEVAARSRLRLPEGYTATAATKSPNEINYEIMVPAEAIHGDYADLALEADGAALGRSRVHLFRAASVLLIQNAVSLRSADGQTAEAHRWPLSIRRRVEIWKSRFAITRRRSRRITWSRAARGWNFCPQTEIGIGPTDRGRRVEFRVFSHGGRGRAGLDAESGLRRRGGCHADAGGLGSAECERGRGTPTWMEMDHFEWVLESAKVQRDLFGARRGDTGWSSRGRILRCPALSADSGAFAQAGAVEVDRRVTGWSSPGKAGSGRWRCTVIR